MPRTKKEIKEKKVKTTKKIKVNKTPKDGVGKTRVRQASQAAEQTSPLLVKSAGEKKRPSARQAS